MFDPERLLGQMLGGSLGDAFGGSRGRRRRSAFSTGNIAGKAQIGVGLLGLAMAAWEHYQQKDRPPPSGGHAGHGATAHGIAMPPPPPPAPPPASAAATRPMPLLDEHQQSIVLLIRAMIAAANADGHIDAAERASILARADAGGVDDATRIFLEAEIARPQTLAQLIANARPELAAETYAAAALAISVDTDGERAWLDALAQGLRLDAAQRTDIDARLASR